MHLSAAGKSTTLGPIDRENFFDAQRRHRRAARRLTGVVAIGMVLVSVPLASLLFPLLFILASITFDLLNLVVPMPNLMGILDAMDGHFAEGPDWLNGLIVILLIVCAPGALLMLAMRRALWSVFSDGHSTDIMVKLGARPLRADDLEERQLANLVDEMAIAAGIHPPAAMVFDSPAANATMFGASEMTATILVSRRLLDECDRDATQAVIGHLIAGISNGDLRLAMEIVTGFAAIGWARELLKSPFSPEGRTLIGEMLYVVSRPQSEMAVALRGSFIERLLSDDQNIGLDNPGKGKQVLFYALLPFLLSYTTFNLVTFAANLLFLSPWLSLLLRQRRYLMDATAVQLTRNPEALKRGLGKLVSEKQSKLPDLREGTLMFIVPPDIKAKNDTVPMGMYFGIYPSGTKRWERIAAMGTGVIRAPSPFHWQDLRTPKGMFVVVLVLVIVGLLLFLSWLLLFLIAATTMLALMVGMVWVMLVCMPVNWLLR